jgi:hypothetical protein
MGMSTVPEFCYRNTYHARAENRFAMNQPDVREKPYRPDPKSQCVVSREHLSPHVVLFVPSTRSHRAGQPAEVELAERCNLLGAVVDLVGQWEHDGPDGHGEVDPDVRGGFAGEREIYEPGADHTGSRLVCVAPGFVEIVPGVEDRLLHMVYHPTAVRRAAVHDVDVAAGIDAAVDVRHPALA